MPLQGQAELSEHHDPKSPFTCLNIHKKIIRPSEHSMMKSRVIFTLAALSAASSNAAVLVTPTSIAYTTIPNQEAPGLNLENEINLINGSGLSASPDLATYETVTHAAVTFAAPGNAWATIDPGAGGGDFYTQGGIAPVFNLSLDQIYTLTDFVYWGYHFNTPGGNEGRQFLLEFSTDGGATYPNSTTVGTPLNTLAISNALTLPLGGSFNADAVRMTITDNHFGGTAAGGDRVGMGEVRFIGDAIPEPSTALLGSLAMLGLLRRRR
jgi:hypothetical protein